MSSNVNIFNSQQQQDEPSYIFYIKNLKTTININTQYHSNININKYQRGENTYILLRIKTLKKNKKLRKI
jgi:hypothetical protein